MRRTLTANVSTIGFCVAVIILLGTSGSTIVSLRVLNETNNRVYETQAILIELDHTLSLLADAEAAQRGFLITGDNTYLDLYEAALDTGIDASLNQLRQLTTDNLNQRQRLTALEPLIRTRLTLLRQVIQIRDTAGFEAAQQIVRTNTGREVMDEIRQLITEMQSEEHALLQARTDAARTGFRQVSFTMILGALLSLTLLTISFGIAAREIGSRRRAEHSVRQLNHDLDQRVHQKTAELSGTNEMLRAEITLRAQAEEAIQESEQRLRTTLDTLIEGCQIIDFDWRYVYLNDAAIAHAKQEKDALLGRTMMEVYPGIETTPLFVVMQRCMEQRTPQQLENEFTFPNGSTGWFDLTIQPVPEGIFILSQDITERKHANAQIEQQLQRLQSLRLIDMAILGTTDLRLTLRIVLQEITARLDTDIASILRFHAPTSSLNVEAMTGNHFPDIGRMAIRLGEGISGKAALESRTISMPIIDPEAFPSHLKALIAREGLQSIYATPLIAKGSLVGVLMVAFRNPYEAKQDWIDFFEALAGQAAMAIDSGVSFEVLQRANRNLTLAYDTTIEGWSAALDLRDRETEGHSQRVTEMTMRLAHRAGMPDEALAHVRRGALLHDVGKLGVPDSILLKPGPLTDEEWQIMQQHPVYAYEWLRRIVYLQPALEIPYCHHEKWDGSGYPRRLSGDQIPLAARLFAVVDVWDALRSTRPYRDAWPEECVRQHIQSLAGMHFDPMAVELFFELLDESE
ncbi:MAG TPA: CHASE3 domain-containing protein [Roseiflexaceae bacterium]|nr:CHASE3 domain-containing protein [Roseiflexaceae bacterium]